MFLTLMQQAQMMANASIAITATGETDAGAEAYRGRA